VNKTQLSWSKVFCSRTIQIWFVVYAIGAYHHWCCEFESRWGRGIYIIVTDMEGNIRIYRLPKGCGPYHDPRAVCLSWYCTLYK